MLYSMLGRNLEAFQIERRGEIVGEYRGERRTENGRQYIEFFEKKRYFAKRRAYRQTNSCTLYRN